MNKRGSILTHYWLVYPFFFFFFQAEDGIRDGHVTGVQTCALPISCRGTRQITTFRNDPTTSPYTPATTAMNSVTTGQRRRSEERRVGKECRSRWSPDQ